MRRFAAALALTALTALAACASDEVGTSADYATDSWAKPTLHGELDFAESNYAEFTASQRFHGWSFEVTGEVDVVLSTAIMEANLDTVMYLYSADETGKKTGAYIAKNDDVDDASITSEIRRTLSPGHYFVQVRAAKELFTGRFAVNAGCTGAGCPVVEPPSVTDYCDSAEESFGKCMDDSLDATEEECAPRGADAMLCCNNTDEWYCGDVCAPANLGLARVWGDDLEAVYGVFHEDDYSYLMDVYSYAFASCADPSLADLGTLVMAADDLLEDDGESAWQVEGWTEASSGDFYNYDVSEDVVSVLNDLIGEEAKARFSASVEIPCPNCTDGYAKNVLYYPGVGKLVVLESRWGGDS